jgi:hypothetical protein
MAPEIAAENLNDRGEIAPRKLPRHVRRAIRKRAHFLAGVRELELLLRLTDAVESGQVLPADIAEWWPADRPRYLGASNG